MILKSRSSSAFCHPPSRCAISTLFSERLKPAAFFSLSRSPVRVRGSGHVLSTGPRSCCVNRSLARHTANALATGHGAGGLHSNPHSSSCGSRAFGPVAKAFPGRSPMDVSVGPSRAGATRPQPKWGFFLHTSIPEPSRWHPYRPRVDRVLELKIRQFSSRSGSNTNSELFSILKLCTG